ncbi:MAG TPA: TetR/AcrR family transcriptional regulator [Kofleriaceae bacterium]|nr:TetR/AcrR family transcriptional regulator [Kofleriaceae bacterium]
MSPRGRPRAFDAEQALDRALQVFWSSGFTASSLDDLCAAMGIARPSLYAAFGDKEDLYLAAIARFRGWMEAGFRAAIEGAETRREGILAFQRHSIARYQSGNTARGCFAICTATTEAISYPRIRTVLAGLITELDVSFAAVLASARKRGELPASADVHALGRMLSATQHTLAVRARAGASTAELDQIAQDSLAVVFGSPAKRRSRAGAKRD